MPQVKINPKGNTFDAREYESILQAGLKAGVALNYGCSNGNCGECLATLVSGEIGKIRHFDFIVPEHQKERGVFPMCCYQAESDLVIEAEEATGVTDIPLQKVSVKVKAIDFVSDQIAKLHVRTPRSSRLRFLAGQTAKLGSATMPDGIYPIASCPCDDMNLYFHIPHIPGDEFAECVFSGDLKKGATLDLRGPKGSFVLGAEIKRPLVLISWHTGFAYMQALIEHAIAIETETAIDLYRLSPVQDFHYHDNLCRAWADAFDNINYHPLEGRYTLLSEETDGRTVLSSIAERHPDLPSKDVYLAGPPSLITAANKLLVDGGLQGARVKCETIAMGFYDE